MNKKQGVSNKTESVKNVLLSAWQIFKLHVSRRKVSTIFIAFPRVDKVGEYYLDKFVDPLVSLCFEDKNDIMILDQGRGGLHPKPRINSKYCVQTEWLVVYSQLVAKVFLKKFHKSNRACLDPFIESLCSVFDLDSNNKEVKKEIVYIVFCALRQIYCYKSLFQHLKCQRILGPSRNYIRRFVVAGHMVGAKSYELQHGVVYGITKDNSGFQPKDCTPDYYLAFGENNSGNVHGIDPEKIVNIGWAFGEYISTIKDFVQYNDKDVLVISDPTITDIVIDAVLYLAKASPKSHFYVRPHPHEEISASQKSRLESVPNAHWQDKRINIAMVMRGFSHVIGENSTVVYEALSAGKKVGRLCFEGFHPRYLKEDDRNCFWEIKDQETFSHFISEDISKKNAKSIYSPFNKELFLQTIGMK
jgi:hypothetical protein